MRLPRSRRGRLTALTAAAAVLAAAGVAYAQIPDPSGVVHGCYAKSGGTLRGVYNSDTSCKSTEMSLNWNQTGPAGPAGPAGPQGPTGAQWLAGPQGPQGEPGTSTTSDWAILNADGTIQASSGVDTLGTGGAAGTYKVDFGPQGISNCAAVATPRVQPGMVIVPTFAIVSRNSCFEVGVDTFKPDGTPVASGFELAVFC